MNQLLATDQLGVQRVCWLAILLFIATAYVAAIAPQERAIALLEAQAHGLYDRAAANDAIVKNAAALSSARRRVVADLVRLRGEDDGSATMAHAVRLLDLQRSRYRVNVSAIVPDASPPPLAPGSGVAVADPLSGEGLTISATGRFRDLVRMLADLPEHDVLLDIREVRLESTARGARSSPLLQATIHATMYRLSTLPVDEVPYVAGSVR